MKETKEQFERRRFQEVCFYKSDDLQAFVRKIEDMETCDEEQFWDCMRSAQYTTISLNRIITMNQLYTALQNHRYQPQMRRLNLSRLMASLICYVGHIAQEEAVQIDSHFPESVDITTDPYLIAVIMGQLLSNAFGCWEDDDTLNFHMRTEGNNAVISITDVIGGICEDNIPFEAYHEDSFGLHILHLGLALSRRAAEFMGGTFEYIVKPSVGTTFILTLPLAETEGKEMDYESCLDGCKQILWTMMADMVAYPWLPGQTFELEKKDEV